MTASNGEWLRWTTAERYYRVLVQQNLFGEWELVRVWGGLHSRLGGYLVEAADSEVAALALASAVARQRTAHGYRPS